MSGSVASRSVDQQRVHFQAGDSVYDARLESVRVFMPDAGGREIVVVAWFDFWTYKRIDRAHLFGYTFESIDREGLQGWEFNSSLPVQLELRVEGAAAAVLADVEGEALLDRAVAGLTGADATSPLRDAANYRYLAMYQSKGAYMSGFTSVYKKQR